MSKTLEQINLRDRKKARIKYNILEVALELIGRGSLEELYVEEICKRAEISRVTFFKYFNRKEDILIYFMRVWCFHLAVEQRQDPLSGIAAIRRMYQRAGDYADRPGIILSLIGFIANLSAPPTPVELSPAERLLHYPDTPEVLTVQIAPLGEMFTRHVEEARESGELKKDVNTPELVRALIGIFYGAALVAHTEGGQDPTGYYSSHLELVLASLTFRR